MDNSFYTYAYLREDGTPYYIGKGKDDRAFDSFNRKTKTPPRERILFLKKNLTEEEAFRHEVYMIAVFGRKQLGEGGILWNFTDGGEGTSGAILTPETRRKMSESRKGRVFSEETRRKIGEKSKGRNVGRRHSHTEEARKKISDARKGKSSPMLGKTHSEETKKKMSETAKKREQKPPSFQGRSHSEETKKRISEKNKGRKHTPEQNSAKSKRQIGRKRGEAVEDA